MDTIGVTDNLRGSKSPSAMGCACRLAALVTVVETFQVVNAFRELNRKKFNFSIIQHAGEHLFHSYKAEDLGEDWLNVTTVRAFVFQGSG